MKYKIATLFSIILIVAEAVRANPIVAKSKGDIVFLVGEKPHPYYSLSNDITYKVAGPGELRINIRSIILDENAQNEQMILGYKFDGEKREFSTSGVAGKSNLVYNQKGKIHPASKKQELVINIPPGQHKIEFFSSKKTKNHVLNAYFKECPGFKWASMSSDVEGNQSEITFTKSGTKRKYSNLLKNESLNYKAQNNTYYRIIARPLFTHRMLDEVVYKIRIKDHTNGRSKVYKLLSGRSSTIEYSEADNLMVGKSNEVIFMPEQPTDEITISLLSGVQEILLKVDGAEW